MSNIISLWREAWVHKNSLIPPLFFYWSTCTKPGKCVKGIDFASFYDFDIGFWNCSNSMVFLVFHSIQYKYLMRWRSSNDIQLHWSVVWKCSNAYLLLQLFSVHIQTLTCQASVSSSNRYNITFGINNTVKQATSWGIK